MTERRPQAGPFQFTNEDLTPDRLTAGVEITLNDFYKWRDANPGLIADHVNLHTHMLGAIMSDYGLSSRLGRRFSRSRQRLLDTGKTKQELRAHVVFNQAEIPDDNYIEELNLEMHDRLRWAKRIIKHPPSDPSVLISEGIGRLPWLEGGSEVDWIAQHFSRLYSILPEEVIRTGGMGKAARTMIGTLAIGVIDTRNEPLVVRKEHIRRILPAAYAYGIMYPIIDDTLQDSNYVSPEDRDRYNQTILHAIRTGEMDSSGLPDHPLAEELERAAHYLFNAFPHSEYPHLYQAGESMYLAQDSDSLKLPEHIAKAGLSSMYPDITIKAAMTRIISNIIGRRTLDEGYYSKSMNINLINQFRDDFQDLEEDRRAGRLTPFTYKRNQNDTNPLYDLFAYGAYITHQVFNNDPGIAEIAAWYCATRMAKDLISNPGKAEEIIKDYETTSEITRFLLYASGLPQFMAQNLSQSDRKLEKAVNMSYGTRVQTEIDPRTFISDRLKYINTIVGNNDPESEPNELDDINAYALSSGGKRIRPALTLMLAEGIGVDYRTIEPLMKILETFHTSTLMFDDLPAQDNATRRRGRLPAHIEFGEGPTQVAAIGLIAASFGGIADLERHYSSDRVTALLKYFAEVAGTHGLCYGQYMDLKMEKEPQEISSQEIIEMYSKKTSLLIEASLVSLMILQGRPNQEIELMKKYAYHAGIVLQLRDDILDMTSTAEILGKDTDNDTQKVNIARLYGIDEAEQLITQHLEAALLNCQKLSFNTNLLQGTAKYFGYRSK